MERPIHYEIHVTVRTQEVQRFMDVCSEIRVKPIVLDLQKKGGSGSVQDVMTSSKITGTDFDAILENRMVSDALSSRGFEVVREKIETVPWHPKAVVYDPDTDKDGYFEAHIPIIVASEDEKTFLSDTCQSQGLHLSRNPFKTFDNGTYVQFITLRRKVPVDKFRQLVSATVLGFLRNGISISGSPEIEFALYDSNVNHDADWINS
jgi:hypothetical protein